jgi:hypothetical protein
MHSNGMHRYAASIVAACVTLTFLVGCGNGQSDRSGTFFGPSQSIGNGTAKRTQRSTMPVIRSRSAFGCRRNRWTGFRRKTPFLPAC